MSQPGCTVDVQRPPVLPPGGPGGIGLPYQAAQRLRYAYTSRKRLARVGRIRRLRGVRVSLGACGPLGRQHGPPTAVRASG